MIIHQGEGELLLFPINLTNMIFINPFLLKKIDVQMTIQNPTSNTLNYSVPKSKQSTLLGYQLFFIYFIITHGYLSLLIIVLVLHQTGTFQNIDWPVLIIHFLFI
ncbi:MAG: hypothetical protein A2W85_13420 [Bacteroidetes bacterium GWF2_41_31]|nr:MAG: hypothetical protein A2W85_13420 [Bacteroidetes bacterium GWF2_41_31]OFZ02324.1 MAG: hypothetical protein A2338_02745 [Bacteroidetes bacterium RIFOXYB12_FULL_41_6]